MLLQVIQKSTSALLLSMLLFTSCKMIDNTEKAVENSGRAADNSERAADTGAAIKDYNQQTMEAMKNGAGLEVREDAYRRAIDEKNFTLKTNHTAVYFQAMGFQLTGTIKNGTLDLAYTRGKQKADAVRDFIKKMTNLMPSDWSKDQISALKKSNDMQTLYAFAAAMHEININQQNNLGNHSENYLKIESFFDIVAESLRKYRIADIKGLVDRSNLSFADKEILREVHTLIYILKLRYKILPVIALGRMSNIQSGLIEKIKMSYFAWDIRSDLGTEQINYINDIFDRANSTKQLLSDLGETVELDAKVLRIYKNLNFSLSELSKQDNLGLEKSKAMYGLAKHLENIDSK